ncbi:phosphonoacetaldehyde hydrolase [Asticcacaulis sp. ZE23SCel15]|uniref:phosphonoacetaldehyde hydrolase n=1 Tax=Asticcacaulis sp. ZE23SCel15 TaxID=3059027 RepID=UPI00265EA79F|nr:phosphonoacetaldehyde hydrolase [Asticcacaulis sp. ZE23SCel15]WKL58941.1 phosphonoacetaldehyde hydrolase [Asticcacaulis sp. ZE23SCel15]
MIAKPHRPQAVIFDWAGTMVDFGSLAPVIAMQQGFAAAGVEVSEAEVRRPMGQAKRDHVAALLAQPEVAQRWRDKTGHAPAEHDIERIYASLDNLMRAAGTARAKLIPGARATFDRLRTAGIRVGSSTGYTRAMMAPILTAAAAQGYEPELVVCAGETAQGRPAPLMIWKNFVELGVWPAAEVVVVDDAPVGITAGKAAGAFTVGVAGSGNEMGLTEEAFAALTDDERGLGLERARAALYAAGADVVIDTVADLPRLLSL